MSSDDRSSGGGGRGDRARAHELIVAASHAASAHRTRELARAALEAWTDCADAFNLLAELTDDPVDAAGLYRQGIEAGRRALGDAVLEQLEGQLWGLHEARPFLRAIAGLAGALARIGLIREAVHHWRELMRLNASDNQGIRERLAPALLELDELEQLERLLAAFDEDVTASTLYARALLHFRRGLPAAEEDLLRAVAHNRYLPDYLLGNRPLPREAPAYTGLGDESEAQACAALLAGAWQRTAGATDWLAGHLRSTPSLGSDGPEQINTSLPAAYAELPQLWGHPAEVAIELDEGLQRSGHPEALRARAAGIWAHYARAEQPKIRNHGAHAAGVHYLLGRVLGLHDEPRDRLAKAYGTSRTTVTRYCCRVEDWLRSSPLGKELTPELWPELAPGPPGLQELPGPGLPGPGLPGPPGPSGPSGPSGFTPPPLDPDDDRPDAKVIPFPGGRDEGS